MNSLLAGFSNPNLDICRPDPKLGVVLVGLAVNTGRIIYSRFDSETAFSAGTEFYIKQTNHNVPLNIDAFDFLSPYEFTVEVVRRKKTITRNLRSRQMLVGYAWIEHGWIAFSFSIPVSVSSGDLIKLTPVEVH